jgi:nitrogen-specific signal transduction histidine kinase
MSEAELHPADISEELKEEIDLFRLLKPFIAYCLTLRHEINNPLSGVLGYADFMLMDGENLTEEQRSELQEIVTCAEKIKEHLDRLGDIKGKLSEKIDLKTVIEFYETAAASSD